MRRALLLACLAVALGACAHPRSAKEPDLRRIGELRALLAEASSTLSAPLAPALYAAARPRPPGEEPPEAAQARWKQSVILTRLNIGNLGQYLAEVERAPLPARKKQAELREYRAHLERERERLARLEAEAPAARRIVDVGPHGSAVTILYRDGSFETLSMDAVLALGR